MAECWQVWLPGSLRGCPSVTIIQEQLLVLTGARQGEEWWKPTAWPDLEELLSHLVVTKVLCPWWVTEDHE